MSHARGNFLVKNKLGLHARAAAKLTQLASRYPCDVSAGNDEQMVREA
jgi:phosphocarrier protein